MVAEEAARCSWPVRHIPTDHLAIPTRPDRVADAIVEVLTEEREGVAADPKTVPLLDPDFYLHPPQSRRRGDSYK